MGVLAGEFTEFNIELFQIEVSVKNIQRHAGLAGIKRNEFAKSFS
jgi:hypothetical protein